VSSDLVSHVIAENRAALGVGEKFSSHAVRSAFMTWCGENDIGHEVRNRCTAHKVTRGIDAVYNAARLDRQAADVWARWAQELGA
jgi:hypothetical protein